MGDEPPSCPGVSRARSASSPMVRPETVGQSSFRQPRAFSRFADEGDAPGRVQVGGDEEPSRLEADHQRRASGYALEVVQVQLDAVLAGDGEEVQDPVGRAAGGGDGGDGVLDGAAGHDLTWAQASLHEVDGHTADLHGGRLLGGIDGRDRPGSHGRKAEDLGGGGHGVGRELAAAGAGARARGALDRLEFVGADAAAGLRPDGLVHVLNRQVGTPVLPGHDGAAVEHESRKVEAAQGEDRSRSGLVASGHGHDAVEHVAARHQFDGIGDHLAAHEGCLHALGAHGDAVGDDDGVELEGCAAGLAHPPLHVRRQIPQVVVAGPDLRPRVGDADQWPGEGVVVVADGLVHGPRSGAGGPFDHGSARPHHSPPVHPAAAAPAYRGVAWMCSDRSEVMGSGSSVRG